jgi:hypothetical protein
MNNSIGIEDNLNYSTLKDLVMPKVFVSLLFPVLSKLLSALLFSLRSARTN